MTESIVSSVVETLGSLIRDGVIQQPNFHTELEHIKAQFQRIQPYLKDADAKGEIEGGEQVKVWLQQLRHVAFDIEDLLEEYVFQNHDEQHHNVHGHGTCGFIYKVKNFLHKNLFQRHNSAHLIEDIKGRLENISNGMENYQFHDTRVASTSRTIRRESRNPQDDALFLDDDDKVVGIDENKNKLITRLITGETSLGVSSVFGVGGVGKTTLVRKVYEDQRIQSHFSICVWIVVSQSYDSNRLLKELIWLTLNEEREKSVGSQLEDMDARHLKEELHNYLQGRRYLVVMDDIWDSAVWREIKFALPDSGRGSRIIVTTRSERIANYCKENSGIVFKVEPLSEDDSLSLFGKMAAKSDVLKSNCSIDQHTKEVILNFLHKCGRLPLAIVAIAGILSTKHTIEEWERIYTDNSSLLSHSELGDVNIILSLSYNDLSNHLKSCLLYLCMFPDYHLIDCSSLLRLWAAEGFCDSDADDITKEDKAAIYLDDLIARGLIQVQRYDFYASLRECRIDNLLRDFILRKAGDQEFAEWLPDYELNGGRLRRVSFSVANDIARNTLSSSLRKIRSLLLFGHGTTCSTLSRMICGGGIKLLKVLHVEDACLAEFPCKILTNLYFLRYLGINAEKFSHPSSLGSLVNLETLVLKGHLLFQLPDEILQLKCLRNIFGDLLKLPKRIGVMTTLEKLNLVVGYDGIDEELRMLTRLRSLYMVCAMEEDKSFALDSIKEMIYLRSLYLRLSNPKDNVLDVQDFRFPRLLERLTLIGVMNGIPDDIFSLENLTQLKLSYSGVRGSALFEGLQRLPKLVELVLEMDALDVAELQFWRGSFSKLITLELHRLSKLKSIEIEEGAMPYIQKIRFIDCPLEHVPVGIEHLTTLEWIGLAKMASNLEGELSHHNWKAGHSPTVISFDDEFEMDSSIIRSFFDELHAAD